MNKCRTRIGGEEKTRKSKETKKFGKQSKNGFSERQSKDGTGQRNIDDAS